MSDEYRIPSGLSPKAQAAAEAITNFCQERKLSTGGCNPFYSPEEWISRGEVYGVDAILIVVHDGGDLASHFNVDYCDYVDFGHMARLLEGVGCFAEACTSWYTAIYPE